MPRVGMWSQIRLLMWKSCLEKSRSKLTIATQAVIPLAMVFLLITIYELLLGSSYNGALEHMFMPFALIVTIPALTTTIVAEKSTRLLESMKMMGLDETAYWMHIVLMEGFIYGTILGFLVACGSKVPHIWDSDNGLFGNAGFGYIWLCTTGYMISSVPFSFFMSVFFDKPKTAGQISFLLVLASIVFGFAYNMTEQGKVATLLVACLPPYAYELMVDRLRPSCTEACEGGVTFEALLLTMCLSSVGFSILAWYIRQVMPSEFGIRKHPLFFLKPSYWCPSSSTIHQDGRRALVKHDSMRNAVELHHSSKCADDNDIEAPQNSKDFERVPSNFKSTVQIRGLRKTFYGGDGKIVAVNDLTLDMYEDNLFVLLGHNGAGKTTTINMLTGLFPPDKGSSGTRVYGKFISREMDSVRNVLGVCPQHDVLIPSLTSQEHCIFFAMLKGSSFQSAQSEASKLLSDFHLMKRKDHFGHMLSGGMRRKLSTILALCGGSKFVILDEPSSGLDPLARRQLWDSLKSVKKGRTILLTTHYMDEADELGDRIGIMDHGKCACIGTSAFLKRRYGCGYVLECEMKDESVDPSSAVTFVTSGIKGAEFNARESYARQLVFTLPFDAVSEFGMFFNKLDKSLKDLKLSEYGVSVTSMEDVFLQVGREGRKKRAGSLAVKKEEESKLQDEVRFGVENQQRASLKTQILVMIRKRLWTARNDYRTIFMLVIPCLVILAFFTLNHEGLLAGEGEDKKVGNGMTSYFSMLAFLFLPGLVAAELVRERSTKLRYTLTVMGCRQYAYFGGMFLGDYVGWMIITVLNWIIIISLSGDDYLLDGGIFLLFPFFGVQLLGFSYMISFWFSQPSYAVVATPGILILQLVLSQVLVGIFQLILVQGAGVDVDDDTNLGLFIWSVTLLCPLGSLGTGLFMCTFNINDVPAGAFPPLPAVMAIMLIQGALYMYRAITLDARNTKDLIARFLDQKKVSEFRDKMHQDVLKEAKDVDTTDPKSIALQIKQLRKVYPRKGKTPRTVAVKSASMQVRKREILCLLGPNGAGKSTTLNMLLRSCNPTCGDAFILGHSVLNDFEAGAISLGVVPQDNNLWPLLSCKQHLQLFAELRGVPHKNVSGVLNSALKHMELQEKSDTLSSHLSGGMQRRLCTAIALIGEPDVILLDEPSAGLDPVSRRNLWDVIRETMSNRAVILTTHSMEEAEALASRIAILVQGQLQCIGTPTHLKKTLGQDFEIVIRMNDVMKQSGDGDNATYQVPDKINDFMRNTFDEIKLIEASGNTVVYDVKREHVNMGHAFTTFEANRDDLDILDYQISQPTLEQVFVRTVLDATPVSEDQKVTTLGTRVVRRRSGSISSSSRSVGDKKVIVTIGK